MELLDRSCFLCISLYFMKLPSTTEDYNREKKKKYYDVLIRIWINYVKVDDLNHEEK